MKQGSESGKFLPRPLASAPSFGVRASHVGETSFEWVNQFYSDEGARVLFWWWRWRCWRWKREWRWKGAVENEMILEAMGFDWCGDDLVACDRPSELRRKIVVSKDRLNSKVSLAQNCRKKVGLRPQFRSSKCLRSKSTCIFLFECNDLTSLSKVHSLMFYFHRICKLPFH